MGRPIGLWERTDEPTKRNQAKKKNCKKRKKTTHVEIRHANIDKSILNISKNIFCHLLLDSLEQKKPRMLKQAPAVPTEGRGFKALLWQTFE